MFPFRLAFIWFLWNYFFMKHCYETFLWNDFFMKRFLMKHFYEKYFHIKWILRQKLLFFETYFEVIPPERLLSRQRRIRVKTLNTWYQVWKHITWKKQVGPRKFVLSDGLSSNPTGLKSNPTQSHSESGLNSKLVSLEYFHYLFGLAEPC